MRDSQKLRMSQVIDFAAIPRRKKERKTNFSANVILRHWLCWSSQIQNGGTTKFGSHLGPTSFYGFLRSHPISTGSKLTAAAGTVHQVMLSHVANNSSSASSAQRDYFLPSGQVNDYKVSPIYNAQGESDQEIHRGCRHPAAQTTRILRRSTSLSCAVKPLFSVYSCIYICMYIYICIHRGSEDRTASQFVPDTTQHNPLQRRNCIRPGRQGNRLQLFLPRS